MEIPRTGWAISALVAQTLPVAAFRPRISFPGTRVGRNNDAESVGHVIGTTLVA
jgi:hypothetical protein